MRISRPSETNRDDACVLALESSFEVDLDLVCCCLLLLGPVRHVRRGELDTAACAATSHAHSRHGDRVDWSQWGEERRSWSRSRISRGGVCMERELIERVLKGERMLLQLQLLNEGRQQRGRGSSSGTGSCTSSSDGRLGAAATQERLCLDRGRRMVARACPAPPASAARFASVRHADQK